MRKFLTTASVLAVCAAASMTQAQAQANHNLWGLDMVGVEEARKRGYTGAGVRVGIMDDAIQFDHPEFAARWMAGYNVNDTPYGPYGPDFHGTHVAGTVAGKGYGVASGAYLYGMNWSVPGASDAGFAKGYRWAASQGVRVINNSWGKVFVDPITGVPIRSITLADMTKDQVEFFYAPLVQALRETVNADIVQVFSTGNSAQSQPGVIAGLPYYFPELQSNWLAVTSVGPSGTIASYAERCGLAAAWCIAAPGGDGPNGSNDAIWSSWPGSTYHSINGTSMAAPHVTGAVAIAAEMFPNATGAELTRLVLQTATDIGDAGIDPIYGWGLLNVGNLVSTADPITGGLYANAGWSRFATLGAVSGSLRQRLATARNAAQPRPRVAFEPLGYFPTGGAALADTGSSRARNSHMWLSPIYGSASISAGPSSTAATTEIGGAVAGVDIINDASTTLGIAAAYSKSELRTNGYRDRASTDALHVGAYGSARNGNWVVEGTAQAALFDQSLQRFAVAGTRGVAVPVVGEARTRGAGLDFSLQVGHEMKLDKSTTVTPYMAFGGRWQDTRTTIESGAGVFALTVPAAHYGQLEAGPGVRVTSSPLADERLTVTGDVSYARLAGNMNNAINVSMLGTQIAARSAEVGRDLLRIGGHVSMAVSDEASWFAGYNGAFQRNATTHGVGAGLKVNF